MSLSKCDQCGLQVSTEAKACPSCGAPPPKGISPWRVLLIGTFCLGVYSCSSGIPDAHKGSDVLPPTAEQIETDKRADASDAARFGLAIDTAKAVRSVMRDPDSLRFDTMLVNRDATISCARYRAKNGFGGMNQEGAVVVNSSLQKATKANWSRYCEAGMVDLMAAVN